MARQRSGFRGRGISESQRRKKTWAALTIGQNLSNGMSIFTGSTGGVPGSSLGLVSFSADSTTGLSESTILRIRGSVLIPKSVPSAAVGAGGDEVYGFGVAMVTDEAAAVGAVPNPASAEGVAWDGWQFIRSNVATAVDATGTIMDVKAMRKFDGGQSLIFVAGVSSDDPAGSSGLQIEFVGRILFLLP